MASKLLFRNLRPVSHTNRHRFLTSTSASASDFPSSTVRTLFGRRMYSGAAAAASVDSTPPPLPEKEKPLPNSKKVVEKVGSVNEAEIAKFTALAEQWWDVQNGPHKGLHQMNPTRVAFLRSALCRHFGRDPSPARPLEGLKIADIGCGGGILSEALARLGADVTGVDAGEENIRIARLHAAPDPETASIEYLCTTAEKLVEEGRQFDAVFSLEVIEHVANPADFCKSLSALTVPGGATALSTINRTMRGYGLVIFVAEYVAQMIPKGTHDWSMFITPEELALMLQPHNVTIQEICGMALNPITNKFYLTDDTGVSYIAFATKASEDNA